MTNATATCHTEDCANAGIAIDVGTLTYEDPFTGELVAVDVSCGVCGEPITDIEGRAALPGAPTDDDPPDEG